jgi:hypothetical protein
MANILTGKYGNANEQVFYSDAENDKKESAKMIFPNGEFGSIGGGEFRSVTKHWTGLFGEKYPYTVVEWIPNQISKDIVIKDANVKVKENVAYKSEMEVLGSDGNSWKMSSARKY